MLQHVVDLRDRLLHFRRHHCVFASHVPTSVVVVVVVAELELVSVVVVVDAHRADQLPVPIDGSDKSDFLGRFVVSLLREDQN